MGTPPAPSGAGDGGTRGARVNMRPVTTTALAALAIILLAWLGKRAGVLRVEAAPLLIQIVLYLTLPALIFRVMARAELDWSLALVPVLGLTLHVVLAGIAYLLARLGRMDRRTVGALIIASAVGNTGFFGLPLIAASGGGLSVPAAVMYDQFATGVLTWTSTIWISRRFGEPAATDAPGGGSLWKNLLLPPIWALMFGLAWNVSGHDLPGWLDRPLEILAAAMLPLVLIYAGLMLDWTGVRREWRAVALATILRLAVAPALAFVMAWLIGLRDDVLRTVVLMSAMPTAMMSLVIGGWFRVKTDVVAGAIVVTAIVAPLVLPLLRAML